MWENQIKGSRQLVGMIAQGHISATVQISLFLVFGLFFFWGGGLDSLEMDEWSGVYWLKPGMLDRLQKFDQRSISVFSLY